MSEVPQTHQLRRVDVPAHAPIIYPRHFGAPLSFEQSAHFPEVSQLVDTFAALLEKRSPEQRSGIRLFFSEKQGAFGLNTFLTDEVDVLVEDGMSADELKLAALLLAKKDVGGIGVTSRPLESVRKSFGNMLETAIQQPWCKKVVVIGNGLSSVPIELAQGLQKGVNKQVVFGDLFSYELFIDEVNEFEQMWAERFHNQSDFAFPEQLQNMREFAQALLSDSSLTCAPPYRFSSETMTQPLPSELQDAQVVLNVMGPPFSTLLDQLRMFSAQGPALLLTVVDIEHVVLPPGWVRHDLPMKNAGSGQKAVVFARGIDPSSFIS